MTHHYSHRAHDQIKLDILRYLFENGPTAKTELEYAIEINNRLFKRETKHLMAAEMIEYASPDKLEIPANKRAKVSDNVSRLFYITKKGKKCMNLMNERQALLLVTERHHHHHH